MEHISIYSRPFGTYLLVGVRIEMNVLRFYGSVSDGQLSRETN